MKTLTKIDLWLIAKVSRYLRRGRHRSRGVSTAQFIAGLRSC